MADITNPKKAKPEQSKNFVAPDTKGSSSTTQGENKQRTANVDRATYTPNASYNPLTQGSSYDQIVDKNSQALSNVADQNTNKAQPTDLTSPNAFDTRQHNVAYSNAPANAYAFVLQNYASELATSLAQNAGITTKSQLIAEAVPNNEIKFQQNESPRLETASQDQKKFVDPNLFQANHMDMAIAPIPTKITTRVNLFKQAGERENPLAVLEGNKFVKPSQQYMTQVNEEFAPRPVLKTFTTTAYIGTHHNSPASPNDQKINNYSTYVEKVKGLQHKSIMGIPVFVIGGAVLLFLLSRRG